LVVAGLDPVGFHMHVIGNIVGFDMQGRRWSVAGGGSGRAARLTRSFVVSVRIAGP
jgi:hypothetical protein